MSPENFAYWIQGVFEGKTSLTSEQQIQLIKDHLALVMTKVTPTYPPGTFDPVILPSTGAGDHWSIPRNPLQDLPTYTPPNPFSPSVGPICSTGTGPRGPIINNCTTAPTLADMGWTGDSTASTLNNSVTLNGNGTTTISINNPNGLECNSDSTTPKSGEYHILNSLSKLRKSDILC